MEFVPRSTMSLDIVERETNSIGQLIITNDCGFVHPEKLYQTSNGSWLHCVQVRNNVL